MCIQIVINTYNTPEITCEYRESFILLDHIRETSPFFNLLSTRSSKEKQNGA